MAKHKLLLADDSITIQKVVNLTFADEGIEVISVGDGNAAMEKLAEITPDLVMADINMPFLNGYEICEHIKGNEATRHIPVILLVGSFEPFDEAEAKRVGADDFLTKPFQSIRQLVTKVSGLLDSAASVSSSTDDIISDLEKPQTKAMPGESDSVLKMPEKESAPEEFGDSGMDDEMIQTSQAGSFGLDETQKFQSKAESEEDFAKTQPFSTSELSEISSYQSSEQMPSQAEQVVSENKTEWSESSSESAVQEQISPADERGYEVVGDTPFAVPMPVAEEENFPIAENGTPSYQNQYSSPSESLYQPEEADVSPTAETDSALELEDDGNLLELPPREKLSAAALSQPVWQEDVASIDESFEPNTKTREYRDFETQDDKTSDTNQFAPDDESQEVVIPETADENQFKSSETGAAEEMPEADASETSESNVGEREAVTAKLIDANQTESSEPEAAQAASETAQVPSLSPEVIEAIVAKISERFSDKIIREIVAEITPQITELIARRITEDNAKE